MSALTRRRSAGLSLIEVVVFIVVLGIGIAGMVVLYSRLTQSSVDPVIRKQTLAIASSLLEEIELRAFTFCDPDEPAVYTASAATAAECGVNATHVEGIGPETFNPPGTVTEERYDQTKAFDNVNDYHGFSMGGATMRSADGTVIGGLGDYSVDPVTIVDAGGVAPFAALPADAVLLITVTARHGPTGVAVSLQGYRFRYAPNSP